MTREAFKKLAAAGTIVLDGATGSNLMAAGMPKGICAEKWICEHREIMIALQRAYREAGSQIVYAPTFTANRKNLAGYGLEDKIEEMNQTLVGISREAVGTDCLVAGDVTTLGRPDEDYMYLLDIYKEQIRILADAGVDLICAETMLGLDETLAILEAAGSVCDLPVICSLTVESDGSLFFGGNVFEAAAALEEMGADAVGINCSVGPDKLESVVRMLKEIVQIPILAKPNAGMPEICPDGSAKYSMEPQEFAQNMKKLKELGAVLIGGCCGTTPEFIREMVKVCGR